MQLYPGIKIGSPISDSSFFFSNRKFFLQFRDELQNNSSAICILLFKYLTHAS